MKSVVVLHVELEGGTQYDHRGAATAASYTTQRHFSIQCVWGGAHQGHMEVCYSLLLHNSMMHLCMEKKGGMHKDHREAETQPHAGTSR
jgi:hypothetical protein